MQNLNDTEPGGLLTDADFEAKLRQPWPINEQPTTLDELSEIGHRLIPWISGAVFIGFIAGLLCGVL
jgi:hypothetical protein